MGPPTATHFRLGDRFPLRLALKLDAGEELMRVGVQEDGIGLNTVF
jgi:hypothetical protein